MGAQESKLEQPLEQDECKESVVNDSAPSTPILTPLDPRSPSVNIARTPLELILGRKLTEGSSEEQHATNGVTENVVLGIDPRSPTVEFNRTPIIISTVVKEPSELRNKNFDNVRKSLVQTILVNSARKTNIPPKLLDSSPISVIPNSHKRKSLVGLLETNIDFTETDLDSVCQAKNNFHEEIPVEVAEEAVQLNSQIETLQIDPEDSEGTTQTPTKGDSVEEKTANSDKEVEFHSEKSPQEKTINVTAQVKDFDKKLTNLIYQDDIEDDNKIGLKFVKVKENNRTPLGVRNSNEEPKKVSRLRVSDKPRPRKSESKIPVFKDTHGKKMGIQCENTPPMKMEEKRIKAKMTQWDGDKTLII